MSNVKSSIIHKVDKILSTFDKRNRSGSLKNSKPLYSYKSEEAIDNKVEYTSKEISKQFNKDRIAITINFKKKALLNNLSINFKNAMIKNFASKNEFRCYEKPKKQFMTDFIKQTELINKIESRKLISR